MSTPRKPAASSAPKTAAKAAPRPAAKAAPRAAAKPVARAAAKPVVKTVAKPAAKPAAKSTAKAAAKVAKPVIDTSKRYKLLTGIDDSNFCQRVSDHLDAGYELYGAPTMAVRGATVYVGQALVRKVTKKATKSSKKKK